MSFVRYTVILGGYDVLAPSSYDGVCITDDVNDIGLVWNQLGGWRFRIFTRYKDVGWNNKTASRFPKIQPAVFVGDDSTLYHDGSVRMLVDPQTFLEYLGDADIAAFLHPQRDCIYDEGDVCAGCGAAEPDAVAKQMDAYRKDGYPAHNGLHASTLLVRRDSKDIRRLSQFWWDQFLKYETRRDQLSLDYCLWKLGIKCATIPGNLWDNELMDVGHHAERRGE